MARDYENLNDLEDLDDRELRDLVRAHLRDHNGIDPDDITVRVADGAVVLEGRVGTDAERRIAEHVLTDVVGLASVQNNLVVDAIRRAESPVAMDDHLAEENRTEGLMLGDRAVPLSPEAEHLADDVDSELSGTTDVGKSISDGAPWIPPESPTQEGLEGTGGGVSGEDH
jgi:hypothetical protein